VESEPQAGVVQQSGKGTGCVSLVDGFTASRWALMRDREGNIAVDVKRWSGPFAIVAAAHFPHTRGLSNASVTATNPTPTVPTLPPPSPPPPPLGFSSPSTPPPTLPSPFRPPPPSAKEESLVVDLDSLNRWNTGAVTVYRERFGRAWARAWKLPELECTDQG